MYPGNVIGANGYQQGEEGSDNFNSIQQQVLRVFEQDNGSEVSRRFGQICIRIVFSFLRAQAGCSIASVCAQLSHINQQEIRYRGVFAFCAFHFPPFYLSVQHVVCVAGALLSS
jgi:hypothetical protein